MKWELLTRENCSLLEHKKSFVSYSLEGSIISSNRKYGIFDKVSDDNTRVWGWWGINPSSLNDPELLKKYRHAWWSTYVPLEARYCVKFSNGKKRTLIYIKKEVTN